MSFEVTISRDGTSQIYRMMVLKDKGGSDPIHKRGQIIPGMGVKALTQVPNPDPSKISKKGEIGNLPPGKYLLAIPSDAWDWYTIVDDPHPMDIHIIMILLDDYPYLIQEKFGMNVI